jgi:hypothetical protein
MTLDESEKKKPQGWTEPGNALELLGKDWVKKYCVGIHSLAPESLEAIWRVWGELRAHIRLGNGKVPLRPTTEPNDYLPLLFKILKDIEGASNKSAAPASPADRLTMAWARQEVQDILELSQPECRTEKKRRARKKKKPRHGSKTKKKKKPQPRQKSSPAEKKAGRVKKSRAKKTPPSEHKSSLACPKIAAQAATELLNAIKEGREFRRGLEVFACLTGAEKWMLAARATKTLAVVKKKPSTQPKKSPRQRSLTRPFDLVPQHGYTTRYLPIDTEVEALLFYRCDMLMVTLTWGYGVGRCYSTCTR